MTGEDYEDYGVPRDREQSPRSPQSPQPPQTPLTPRTPWTSDAGGNLEGLEERVREYLAALDLCFCQRTYAGLWHDTFMMLPRCVPLESSGSGAPVETALGASEDAVCVFEEADWYFALLGC